MDLYEAASVLGVSINDDIQTLSSRYTELALQYHPNRNKAVSSKERVQQINQAYISLVGRDEGDDMNNRKADFLRTASTNFEKLRPNFNLNVSQHDSTEDTHKTRTTTSSTPSACQNSIHEQGSQGESAIKKKDNKSYVSVIPHN